MLLSYEFIKAENEYRRERFRDQSKPGTRTLEKTAATILVFALILTACGVAVETEPEPVHQTGLIDQGPAWQPNYELLERVIRGATTRNHAGVPTIEFGGMAAPGWQPNPEALESITRPGQGAVNNIEPTWHPNYGRLETRLGGKANSGLR